jgi:hypothetical protein
MIQRTLLTVWNGFARCFGRGHAEAASENDHGWRIPHWWTFGRDSEIASSILINANSVQNVDLNIPNTVAYVRGAIPLANQQKADEIVALKVRFDALAVAPAIPAVFGDNILSDIMSIPVFDASHPGVQAGLPALRAAVAGAAGAVSTLSNYRTMQHMMDRDNLEACIDAGHSWAPAKCPICRHPEHGGIRREYLRIDTGVQDDILRFLRAATGA